MDVVKEVFELVANHGVSIVSAGVVIFAMYMFILALKDWYEKILLPDLERKRDLQALRDGWELEQAKMADERHASQEKIMDVLVDTVTKNSEHYVYQSEEIKNQSERIEELHEIADELKKSMTSLEEKFMGQDEDLKTVSRGLDRLFSLLNGLMFESRGCDDGELRK